MTLVPRSEYPRLLPNLRVEATILCHEAIRRVLVSRIRSDGGTTAPCREDTKAAVDWERVYPNDVFLRGVEKCGSGAARSLALELMQLEMFVAMVEEGSVRGAAERVFRTQPAVSIAVSKLERELEAPLFDRSKRHEYCLTQLGEALYNYATRMLNLRRETLSVMGDIRNLRTGRVRIGANESVSLHLLPKLAQAFLSEHSGVGMEVKCDRSKSLLAELKDRNLDLALLSFRPEDQELDSKFVMQDELVLITSPTHPFAGKSAVHIKDLSEQSLMVMDVSEPSPWHKKIAEAFVQVKAPLHLTVENAPIETIKKMAAIGLGVGFVPLMSVGEEVRRGELTVVEVDGFHLERSVWLVRRRAVQSPTAKAFMQTVIRFGEKLRGLIPVAIPSVTGCSSLSPFRREKAALAKRQA